MIRLFLVLAAGLVLLSGCQPPDRAVYPLTGAECGPDDPVRDLSIPPCPPAL